MKLSKKEVKRVLRAADFIATGRYKYSCHALAHADNCSYFAASKLVHKFGTFYDMPVGSTWFGYLFNEETQAKRVMLLLAFAELGSRGVI